MITLQVLNSKTRISDNDYMFDKMDKFDDLLCNLTPKFSGNWKIVLLQPKIKYIKSLVDSKKIPSWIEVVIYVSQKALDEIALEFPSLAPKKLTAKEEFMQMVANMRHIIEPKAVKAIYASVGANTKELQKVLNELDNNCTSDDEIITTQSIKGTVSIVKRVYASDVLRAFLFNKSNKWSLYDKLVHDIGRDIAYYAMYNQAKKLLTDKYDYLTNKDVKNYTAREVDATFICYVYVLFANSTSSYQLPAILYAIENRSMKSLNAIQQKGI